MNLKAFFDSVRGKINLTTQNVEGFTKVLEYGELRRPNTQRFAYILATCFWETAQTMQPVKEAYWKNETWRKKNLRYYPWYGRGYIQTTWEENYRKIAVAMGLPADTFLKKPDLLLEPKYALPAMFVGMELGIYTGKDLDDYIDGIDENDAEDLREYIAARRIVNGTDKQTEIGRLAIIFEYALKAAGYDVKAPATPAPKPEPKPPAPIPAEMTWLEWIKSFF